eukprot:scaffold228215_cov21-Tisochrysis_lutea.AAC.1
MLWPALPSCNQQQGLLSMQGCSTLFPQVPLVATSARAPLVLGAQLRGGKAKSRGDRQQVEGRIRAEIRTRFAVERGCCICCAACDML